MSTQISTRLATNCMRCICYSSYKPLVLLAAFVLLTSCVSLPDVYIIDHHTVMEEEASGEWPKLEQRFHDLAVHPGPVNLANEKNSQRRKRTFSILNGEMTTSSKEYSGTQ